MRYHIAISITLLFFSTYFAFCEGGLELKTVTLCAGRSVNLDCTQNSGQSVNNQSIVFFEAFNAIKSQPTTECEYNPDDCKELLSEFSLALCVPNKQKCTVISNLFSTLNSCGDKKNQYTYWAYHCVPISLSVPQYVYNVCDSPQVNSDYGIITSPNYPVYNSQNNLCVTKIEVPLGKTVDIWVSDIFVRYADQNQKCVNDYLEIYDTTFSDKVCGQTTKNYKNKFCSNVIYVSYRAATIANFATPYRGFRLYYEVRDSTSSSCVPGTPPYPLLPVSTTPMISVSTTPVTLINTQATAIFGFQLCKGSDHTFTANPNTVFVAESIYYRTTDNLECTTPDKTHCGELVFPTCNYQSECKYSLRTDFQINRCSALASYIYIEFRYIPIESSKKIYLVDADQGIDGAVETRGLILSKNYPNWETNLNIVNKNLYSSKDTDAFNIYITDISMDEPNSEQCVDSFLNFDDGVFSKSYCGRISVNSPTLLYTSCTNNVKISYKSSNNQNSDFRGFRAYYELIKKPLNCYTIPATTTQSLPLTTTPESLIITSSVFTNIVEKPCVFPFQYKDQQYDTCIQNDDIDYWCSTTSNYDADTSKAYCRKGLTSTEKVKICRSKKKTLKCPRSYLINIISVKGAITSDNSCDESKTTCSESLYNGIRFSCTNKNQCDVIGSFLLPQNCQNKNINYILIDFNCLPDTTSYVPSYDICNTPDPISESSGLIQTLNYPSDVSNKNCLVKFQNNGNAQKFLRLFAVNTDLSTPLALGSCESSFLQINNNEPICGKKQTQLLYENCYNSLNLSLVINDKKIKGVRLFYEFFDIQDTSFCVSDPTPTLFPPSTTTGTPEDYVVAGIASPVKTLNLCPTQLRDTVSCPVGYAISVTRSFYGQSKSNKCFFSEPSECVEYRDIVNADCAGKQSCNLQYTLVYMDDCRTFSNYLQFEYVCIPVYYTKEEFCGRNFTTSGVGILSTSNYPNYDENRSCNGLIRVNEALIIKAYIIDLSIKDEDSIVFSDTSFITKVYKGQVKSSLAIETCTNRLSISLTTGSASGINNLKGALIYYEQLQRPVGFQCDFTVDSTLNPTSPLITMPLITTTIQSTVSRPFYYGLASSDMKLVGCKSQDTITCPENYVIIVKTSEYGVHEEEEERCSIGTDDCYGPFLNPTTCSGLQNCTISFRANLYIVPNCRNRKANFYYVDYQCVPAKNNVVQTVQACYSSSAFNLNQNTGLFLQSAGYPSYPKDTLSCKQNFTVSSGSYLLVYIMSSSFPGPAKCGSSDFNLKIYDQFQSFTFCSLVNAKYVFESQSNWITVEFNSKPTPSTMLQFYKGFLLYLQTDYKDLPPVSTPSYIATTTTPRSSINLGFASNDFRNFICQNEKYDLSCPENYVIVVTREYIISTQTGCTFSQFDCRQPTNQVSSTCSGKTNCTSVFNQIEISNCPTKYADILEIEYQCIPQNQIQVGNDLIPQIYTCTDSQQLITSINGFIQSPGYPSYAAGVSNCELAILPPEDYSLRIYFLDISLNNYDPSDYSCRDDYVNLKSVDVNITYCSTENIPTLKYSSRYPNATIINFRSTNPVSSDLRGFKIYFESFVRREINFTRTTTSSVRKLKTNQKSDSLVSWSLGIGLTSSFVMLVALIILRRRNNSSSNHSIKYSTQKNDTNLSENITSFENPLTRNSSLYDNSDLNR